MRAGRQSATKNMTSGSILNEIIWFALPLMLGNIFQMLYNTVDSIVVGNFVGTEALAAVGATTMITNMAVFFFNGFSVGAGVIIGRFFGAGDLKRLHRAVETTMAMTGMICVIFTVLGILGVGPMLHFMSTPSDVMDEAATYLRIYFGGISGLLIYNMGSGILRAVGDTTRPLYFLILTSLLNVGLDLLFVVGFHMGIGGAAGATILSQFISAGLTLMLLLRSDDVYQLTLPDLKIDGMILKQIFQVGLPTGIQAVITAFSNVFVQSYINCFGASCMAGWASYNKIDQFVMLPMQSMAMAATTFVSQNVGAGNTRRSNDGTRISIGLTLFITLVIDLVIWIFARQAVGLFSSDQKVLYFGVLFVRTNIFFLLFNCVNHVLAGALRGRGDSAGPMIIMLIGFVAVRQTYLYIMTHHIFNSARAVSLSYPVGWGATFVMELVYFLIRWNRAERKEKA
jgi:putative MATE family efflux protein